MFNEPKVTKLEVDSLAITRIPCDDTSSQYWELMFADTIRTCIFICQKLFNFSYRRTDKAHDSLQGKCGRDVDRRDG